MEKFDDFVLSVSPAAVRPNAQVSTRIRQSRSDVSIQHSNSCVAKVTAMDRWMVDTDGIEYSLNTVSAGVDSVKFQHRVRDLSFTLLIVDNWPDSFTMHSTRKMIDRCTTRLGPSALLSMGTSDRTCRAAMERYKNVIRLSSNHYHFLFHSLPDWWFHFDEAQMVLNIRPFNSTVMELSSDSDSHVLQRDPIDDSGNY